MPLVGVDPAIVLSYRDEYKEALGDSRGDFHVLTAHEWLTNQLESNTLQSAVKNIAKSDRTFEWHLFPHCTESTLCRQSERVAVYFCAIWTNIEYRESRLLWYGGCIWS